MSSTVSYAVYTPSYRGLFVCLRPFIGESAQSLVDPVDHDVARRFSAAQSRQNNMIAFAVAHGVVYVATVTPTDSKLITFLADSGDRYTLCRAEAEDILHAQDRVYGLMPSDEDEALGSYLLRSGALSSHDLIAALDRKQADLAGQNLGAILLQQGFVTHWDLAEAVAVERGYPLIDLLRESPPVAKGDKSVLDEAWKLAAEQFWYHHLAVPLAMDALSLTVAVEDVDDHEGLSFLERTSGRRLRVFVTGYRDIMKALNDRFGTTQGEDSRLSLFRLRPEDSAAKMANRPQTVFAVLLFAALAAALSVRPVLAGSLMAGTLELFYAAASVFRLWVMMGSLRHSSELTVSAANIDEIPPHSLPAYTVLVPLYKEASVLPTLAAALRNLRYPKDRLDVKLLLEADDEETLAAARAARLPSYMEIVTVPTSEPRTKPKACNYGLAKARGEFVVIFDAEDIPEPDQLLKAISIFRSAQDDRLACIQAKLSYYNVNQNALTCWFTAEYANWFELLLPSLFRLNMPIPLGGTSNHFRTDVLRSLGAWDPFNVTEDADLGVRLHKAGYHTGVMNSITYEEANSDFINWIRQRSRWVKGYLQTWLVHMRHPVRLWRELGTSGFWGFQLVVGGTAFQFLVNPFLWVLTLAWFVFGLHYIEQVFSGWVYYLGNLSLFLGNIAFIYANMVGAARAKQWRLVKWAVLSPVYWIFMSIASYKALFQLLTKPSYWEKTVHGLTEPRHITVSHETTTTG